MKTISFFTLYLLLLGGCDKEISGGPDRAGTGQLTQKKDGISISLFKEGVLLDKAESNYDPAIDGSLEPFDRDITISFSAGGAFWQVINTKPRKGDTLQVSIHHKEQAWCSHCSYFNGNYGLEISSKQNALLVDRTLGVSVPVNKKKTTRYNYSVTDDSDQDNRFFIVLQ